MSKTEIIEIITKSYDTNRFKCFYDVEGLTNAGVPQRWLLTINITEYDEKLIKFYEQKGLVLENRQNSEKDPSFLEASLSNGQLPRDKFKRIYSKTDLNGFVTRRAYTRAIDEIQTSWIFDDCKLLLIYIGGHGVTGDRLLFSDGRTIHYTDILKKFRSRLRMMNKPIIMINNICRPRSSDEITNELPPYDEFVSMQNSLRDDIQSDSAPEKYVYYDDRGPHNNLYHTGWFYFWFTISSLKC